MIVTATIRTENFRSMCRELASMSGKDYDEVLVSEAASCVKIAALQSPIASKSEIERQVQERYGNHWEGDLGEWSVNVRESAGRVWFWDKDSGQARGHDRALYAAGPLRPGQRRQVVSRGGFYMLFDAGPSRGHHVPDPIWHDYLVTREMRLKIVAERTKEVKKRAGIERLSWLQIGDSLGVQLALVAPTGNLRENIARGAAVRGRQYPNGSGRRTTDRFRLLISVTNESPVAIKRFGQRRIEDAIRRRRALFDHAMRKGYFNNLEWRAKRWRGIFVKPT